MSREDEDAVLRDLRGFRLSLLRLQCLVGAPSLTIRRRSFSRCVRGRRPPSSVYLIALEEEVI